MGEMLEEGAVPEAPEPTPAEPVVSDQDTGDEAQPWAGPSQEEWQQTQQALQQFGEFMGQVMTPAPVYEPEPEAQLPEFDMFDPEGVRAHDEWMLSQFEQRLDSRLAPVLNRENEAQADAWVENTFGALGVPEDDLWREGVLFIAAGFQQYDEQGRPTIHPQQAAQQGYGFLQRFAEMIREDERGKMNETNEATDEAIRARAESPELPTGPAGAEGVPEGIDELEAARRWRERQTAAGSM